MKLSKSLNHLKITFDNEDVIHGTITIEDQKNFNDETVPEITNIVFEENEISQDLDLDAISTTIIMSVNETGETQWYSEVWGFEYMLYEKEKTLDNEEHLEVSAGNYFAPRPR